MMPGWFVSFEGGEGAGKSTVMAAAGALLARLGVAHRVTREPGGTPLGEALRALVLDPRFGTCAEAEVLMMFASRAQHVVETIRPTLASGEWILSDRYTDASFAYQGGGRGMADARLRELEAWAAFGLQPQRTYLLDVPVDEGMRRVAQRGGTHDRMEREHTEFFERVRASYRARAAAFPERFVVLDATRPLPEVVAAVEADLARLVQAWREATS
jgi:dTMP kinase